MTNGKLEVITLAYLILFQTLSVHGFPGTVNIKFLILTSSSFQPACNDLASYYVNRQQEDFGNTVTIVCKGVTLSDQKRIVNGLGGNIDPGDFDKVVLYIMRTHLMKEETDLFSNVLTSYPMMVNGMLLAYNIKGAKVGDRVTLTQQNLYDIATGRLTSDAQRKQILTTWSDPTNANPVSLILRNGRLFANEILVHFLEDYVVTKLGKQQRNSSAPLGLASMYPQVGRFIQFYFDKHGSAAQYPNSTNPSTWVDNSAAGITSPLHQNSTTKKCHLCNAGRANQLNMAGLLGQSPNTFAVMGQEEVEAYGLPTALIQNKDGQFVTCNELSTESAFDNSAEGESLINRPGKNTYPLLDYVNVGIGKLKLQYGIPAVKDGPLLDCDILANALHFLNWMIDDKNEISRQILSSSWYELGEQSRYQHLVDSQRSMRCGENKMLVKEFVDQLKTREALILSLNNPSTYITIFFGMIGGAVIIYFGGRMLYMHLIRLHRESLEHFSIRSKRIRITPAYLSPVDRFKGVVASRKVVDRYIPTASIQCISTGTWGDIEVFLRPCSLVIHRLRHETRMKILEMMEELKHPYIVPFFGMTELQQSRCLVCSFCPFGDLRTLIIAKHYEFSMNTKFSLAGDIADGMEYIHRKGFVHGNLRSCAIYIEADWTARVSDYEYDMLHQVQGSFHPAVIQLKQKLNLYQQTSLYPWLYWTSPEILQQGIIGREVPPEKSADVYSFGIVCAEIFSMTPAYQTYQELPYKLTPAQILNGILSADMRPRENWRKTTTPICVLRLMEYCWQEDPTNRPPFSTIRNIFRSVRSLRRHVADKIMIAAEKQCEQFSKRLQSVDAKIRRLDNEFHKLSQILLPPAYWRTVYKQKLYTTMTRHELGIIFYCNLVMYDSMITSKRAVRALECVNLLHRGFQDIIEDSGRVYRMYRNGIGFAALGNVPYGVKEDPIDSIARLAFDFMTWAWHVKVPANLMDGFQLQIGIHSGPMAAGTLKYSTNHYTPLGRVQKEAWNISRSSAPCRVLISEDFHQKLRQLAQIFIKYRIIPNQEKIFGYKKQTYWLVGMNYYRQQSLLDDIFFLDPENLEAASKLREMEIRERQEGKGVLRNELVKVVSALPFDYQALKTGGQQYIVDSGEKDRRSDATDNTAKTIKSIQLVDSYNEPDIFLHVPHTEAMTTQGSRPIKATKELVGQEDAQKEVKNVVSLSDVQRETKKHEEQALKHLRQLKKQEQELIDQKKEERQHIMQLHHELIKVAQNLEHITKDNLGELEKNMDQEITIRVPVLSTVAHINPLSKMTHHGETHYHKEGHEQRHDQYQHGLHSQNLESVLEQDPALSPEHNNGQPGLIAPPEKLEKSVPSRIAITTKEEDVDKVEDAIDEKRLNAVTHVLSATSTLSKIPDTTFSTETNTGGLQRVLRAAAAEYAPVSGKHSDQLPTKEVTLWPRDSADSQFDEETADEGVTGAETADENETLADATEKPSATAIVQKKKSKIKD